MEQWRSHCLAWSSATAIGIVAGNILPASAVSALSVALYGMFLAIVIPPTKKNKVLGGVVLISFVFSGLFTWLPVTKTLSASMRTIILTIVIARSSRSIVSSEGRNARKEIKTMQHNIYLYIMVSAPASFAVRAVPLTLIRKKIRKSIFKVIFILCTVCNVICHDFSSDCRNDCCADCRSTGTYSRNHCC